MFLNGHRQTQYITHRQKQYPSVLVHTTLHNGNNKCDSYKNVEHRQNQVSIGYKWISVVYDIFLSITVTLDTTGHVMQSSDPDESGSLS